jgi:hypothetical protein
MVEIPNFKKGATIIKLHTAVTNLNVQGILMSHCGKDKSKLVKIKSFSMKHLHMK